MTPAIRALEQARVTFRTHTYEHDPAAEAFGLEAAEKLHVAPERVYKTLVAQVDGTRLVMGLVPVAAKLGLKSLAAAAGGKRAEMAEPAAAERATGYVVGGISPLGGRKALPVVLDASALAHATIFISAGRRGLQVELSPHDLVRLTRAHTADILAVA